MNDSEIQILKASFRITDEQLEQYKLLCDLYVTWNAKVNLISRKDIDNLFTHHILHSLSIAKVINFCPNSDIVDVGCGGGLPGLPLAIMFPQTKFTLLDSIHKKINIVQDISISLGLTNVTTICQRVENYKIIHEFIIGRGVCNWSRFIDITRHLCRKNTTIIYLTGLANNDPVDNCIFMSDIFDIPFFENKVIRMYKPLQ